MSIAQKIIVPPKHQNKNGWETRFMAPIAVPKGIPIIKPNPIKKEGAIAMSGLLASEKRTMKTL
jgi:hypothetical protein